MSNLLRLYVDRFNRRDWDGLRDLISADARLQVADRFRGALSDSPYFGNYARLDGWRMALGDVDGEPAIVSLFDEAAGWTPRSCVRLELAGDRIVRVTDYRHCPWMFSNVSSLHVQP
jgi:RNA polymerase sigma-70 factor, ECF subfamily